MVGACTMVPGLLVEMEVSLMFFSQADHKPWSFTSGVAGITGEILGSGCILGGGRAVQGVWTQGLHLEPLL
jgi:hypothetical protein